ncbi:MAG: ArsR family transcriptional regulator [Pirellula sp.]|nr:ArsR family transcriptional regulator [Pirellula sp.]
MKKPEEFQWCAERLKALGDPERLRIITVLLSGPRNVSAIAEELDDAIVKVSHHLGVLRHSGIVQTTKQGRHVEYALASDVFVVANVSDTENFLDLGCCRLELPATKSGRRSRE